MEDDHTIERVAVDDYAATAIYMKQPATPEYRKLLGDTLPDEMTHATNVATGRKWV